MELSLNEAARLLGKSDRQVRYLIRSGKLQARKADGRWIIRREDLPLSEGQVKAERQKAERASRLAAEILRPDAERAGARKSFSVQETRAFEEGGPLYRDLRAQAGADRRVTALLETILVSGDRLYRRPAMRTFYPPIEGGDHRPRGLPIGNLTSQWWGNLYLDGLDHFVKRELKVEGYLRYMDDLVLFADEPARLRRWRRDVEEWLWEHRRLRLNRRKAHVRSADQAHGYLGYRVTRSGFDLGPKAVRRFRRQLPGLLRGDLEPLHRTLASWNGAMRF